MTAICLSISNASPPLADHVQVRVSAVLAEELLLKRLSCLQDHPHHEDQALLQKDLDKLQKWERDWLMQFNPDKYEVIRITNKRNPLTNKYYIHDTELLTVKDAKYLGVTVSSSTWITQSKRPQQA